MTEGGKNLPVFFFLNEHNNPNMKLKSRNFSKLSPAKAASGGKRCR